MKVSCTQGLLLCLNAQHRLVYILGEILEFNSKEGAQILEMSPENFQLLGGRGDNNGGDNGDNNGGNGGDNGNNGDNGDNNGGNGGDNNGDDNGDDFGDQSYYYRPKRCFKPCYKPRRCYYKKPCWVGGARD